MTAPEPDAPEHGDALHDAIAMVEAAGTGDLDGAKAIMENMEPVAVAVRLARLLAELVAENAAGNAVCGECFRVWALGAGRPRGDRFREHD